MAIQFKDAWLEAFYEGNRSHRKIPGVIEDALFRKLQILDAATQESDLRAPPGNRFEHLSGRLSGWCSIRVNRQYRLIFQWADGIAANAYLDPHTYGG
ncbi:MAG TPA: type II toxin-antitoxin system RelE/ParE family toxin [Castellaniella sp.]|jgi:proteic killer suppression protein|nr:type II toxin-antitoxin system RelE/ParE family toxin [Castellaniella sp.]